MNENCITCGKEISKDEVGINKKLFDEHIDVYQCISCLSQELGITEKDLQRKIEGFKNEGCVLFE